MLRKVPWLIVIALVLVTPAAAKGHEEAVRRDVEAYFAALRLSDFPTLAELTCPEVVESVGGYGTFIGLLQQMDQARRAQGIEWGEVTVQSISDPVVAGDELHVLVKLVQQIELRSGKKKKKTYVLGVSANDGESWTFVDATKLGGENKKKLFPNFNDALELPGS